MNHKPVCMRAGVWTLWLVPLLATGAEFKFRHQYVDNHLPGSSWGQTAIADVDRDGKLDFITGRSRGEILWYRQEALGRWARHPLGEQSASDVGGATLDVDGDGWVDFITGGVWYRNTGKPRDEPFERIVFDPELASVHDLVVADVGGDGRPDILTMSDKNNLRWYRIPTDPRQPWQRHDIGSAVHAGIGVGDLDGDGDLDVARSNLWFENADGKGTKWVVHKNIPFGNPHQPYPLATHCVVLDVERDGDNDLVMVENEIKGGRIGWLENLDGKGGTWKLHELRKGDDATRGAYHSLIVADFDNDGDADVFSCEMEGIPGDLPPRWFLWENADGKGKRFVEHVILDANLGGHLAVAADIDGDGDLDIISKLWRPRRDNANGGRNHVDLLENGLNGAEKHSRGETGRGLGQAPRNQRDSLWFVNVGPEGAPFSQSRGPLRVHPGNPRYFTDGTGKAVYLTGSHTWNNFQHNGVYPAVDYDQYLDFLERYPHNFIRLWVWEQGGWDPWANDHVPVGPLAYTRTGPGNALDGKPKYDLAQFNDEYFTRLRHRVRAAGDRGIYVSVMLFEGWSVEKKGQVGNPWQGHPFNQANNINGIDGDLNGDGQGPEIHTLNAPRAVLDLQQAYVRRVIDTLNDLDNVLYEIGNEMHKGSDPWQYRMIDFIHAYQKQKPRQHPVGMTGAPIDNAELFASPADWIAPTSKDGYNDDPPAADGRKVIVSDVDHVWPRSFPQWPWKSFTRGLNTAFMDLYGATRIGDKEIKGLKFAGDWLDHQETSRRRMGHTLMLARRVNLAAMTPQGTLASTDYCLAHAGPREAEYIVYLPDGGGVTLDLSKSPGTLAVEWIDADRGRSTPAGEVEGGSVRSFKAPFDGDAVLYLRGRK